MPRIRFSTLPAFERTLHATALSPGQAVTLQRTDLRKTLGRVTRGKGYSRAEPDASATTITACGVLVRKDCRRVLIDSNTAGAWRAHPGIPGRSASFTCVGPMPEIADLEPLQDGDRITYVPANAEGTTVIWSGAASGEMFEIFATGRWGWDPTPTYWTTTAGATEVSAIGDVGGNWDTMRYGTFTAKQPGSSTWSAIGTHGYIQATAAGNILGSFADNTGAFTNNVFTATVLVRKLG